LGEEKKKKKAKKKKKNKKTEKIGEPTCLRGVSWVCWSLEGESWSV
jgi:hypothetical protein